jgi:hypothetical protein
MKGWALIAAGCAALMGASAQAETLDNRKVVQLIKVGLGNEAVIAKINASATQFDVSTDALVALKTAGVPSPVIAAMIDASSGANVSSNAAASSDSPDPKAPHPSGIYLLETWRAAGGRMLVIDPTTSNQTKTGGFLGYALTGGIASMSFKTVIPNAHAHSVAQTGRPAFYFYFDRANRSLSGGAASTFWMNGSVTSPNEFSLVRFDVKDNRREAKVGKLNIGGAKAGVMDKDRIPFSYTQIAPGVFEVKPDAALADGEYGFLYSSSTGTGAGMAGLGATTAKIFDFSITGQGQPKR